MVAVSSACSCDSASFSAVRASTRTTQASTVEASLRARSRLASAASSSTRRCSTESPDSASAAARWVSRPRTCCACASTTTSRSSTSRRASRSVAVVRGAGSGPGGVGVVGGAADGTVGTDRELAGDLRRHPVEALLADLDQRLAREEPGLGRLGNACSAAISWVVSDSAVRAARVRERSTSRSAVRASASAWDSRAAWRRGSRAARTCGISSERVCTRRSSAPASSRERVRRPSWRSRSAACLRKGRTRAISVSVRGRGALVLGDLLVVERGDAEHRRRA